jgi:hypothetical protein
MVQQLHVKFEKGAPKRTTRYPAASDDLAMVRPLWTCSCGFDFFSLRHVCTICKETGVRKAEE